MEVTRENILSFIDSKKEVYAENTKYPRPTEGYEFGDEVIESESEFNEALNYIEKQIQNEFPGQGDVGENSKE